MNTIEIKKDAKSLADLTFKLQKICQEKESYFASKFNLTSMEFRCLKYLNETSYMTVKELAETMNLTSSRITYIITSLEEKNLIERKIDKSDRRNMKVNIKEEARELVTEIEEKHTLLHEEIFGNLSDKQRGSILESLNFMFDTIKSWSEATLKK